jgi:hypothetical protein
MITHAGLDTRLQKRVNGIAALMQMQAQLKIPNTFPVLEMIYVIVA